MKHRLSIPHGVYLIVIVTPNHIPKNANNDAVSASVSMSMTIRTIYESGLVVRARAPWPLLPESGCTYIQKQIKIDTKRPESR